MKAALAIALAACQPCAAADNPAEVMELGRIDVIGTTPLPGLGTPIENVPANVQVFSRRDVARRRASSLASFLERDAASVTLNAAQGNAFQPDLSYRGFTASPLLGVPQGLAVFQDGVRINEPFGDVVNWDLLPQSAIASIQLIPGSAPAFGPNTLGGALAVYTKSGSQFPGGALEVQAGSFGRSAVQLEQGGSRGAWDYFLTGNLLDEDGWAAHNPSRLRQLFAKVGYQTDRTDVDVSLTAADNALQGTQTLPVSFLGDYRQAYTYPDRNANRLAMLAAKASRFLGDAVLLGGTAYVRKYRNENFASNVNTDFAQPGDLEATNELAIVEQRSGGVGLQLTLGSLALGASGDWGRARFTRMSQAARFTADRGTQGIGGFEPTTDATSTTASYGLFASQTYAPNERWSFTASARHNVAMVRIEPLEDGAHRFAQPGVALGATFNPAAGFTTYASYSTSMRAPTPIELTCADAAAPCKLPNNFVSDPPLHEVIARTVEVGARGNRGDDLSWSAAGYRTELDHDIYFATSGAAANAGYFRDVGRTRRQGIELMATTRFGTLELAARYGYVLASFADGHHIPAIPAHTLKLRVDYGADGPWSIGANAVAASASYARGDEGNDDVHGKVPGYAVVNLSARWRMAAGLEIFALVENLLDKRYASFGVLAENLFVGPGRTFGQGARMAEQFRGLGAPRGAWAGVRFSW